MLITGLMADKWLERNDLDGIDFSSLKVLGMSGGNITPEKMELYKAFFREHGYQHCIVADYGVSEADGDPTFTPEKNDSAYTMYDLFNSGTSGSSGGFTLSDLLKPWKLFAQEKPEKKQFKMPEIPENVMKAVLKYGNRLSGISNGRRWMDFDFED